MLDEICCKLVLQLDKSTHGHGIQSSVAPDSVDYFSNVTDDILNEILSRLPVESVPAAKLVCRTWNNLIYTRYFVQTHLQKASAVTFATFVPNKELFRHWYNAKLFMFVPTDNKNIISIRRITWVKPEIDSGERSSFDLIAHCNGILLLQEWGSSGKPYVLFNPMTQEFAVWNRKKLPGCPICNFICNFFFDEVTKDYTFIMYARRNKQAEYFLYSLRTKSRRCLGVSSYMPLLRHASVSLVLSRTVFCLGESGQSTIDNRPSIIMFKLDIESIEIKPHPTDGYCSESRSANRLLDMEGKLAFLEFHAKLLNIWVLEDLEKFIWIKRYMVDFCVLSGNFRYLCCGYYFWGYDVEVFNIQDGEMLLKWSTKGLFSYNLKSKTVRRIGTQSKMTTEMLKRQPANGVTCLQSLVPPMQIMLGQW